MRLRDGLAAALLALCAPAAAYGLDPATGSDKEAVQAPALEHLLDFVVNETDVIESATANFDVEFERTFKSGGGDAAETRFPGITAVVKTAGKQEMIAILRDNYPALRADAAAMLGQSMTPHEMEQANAFYSSPTGRKLVRAAVSGARGSDVGSLVSTAQDAALGAMGPEDTEALVAFARSDVFPKISELGPKMQQSSAEWANTVMTRSAERMQKSVQTAAAAHIAGIAPQPGQ